MKANVKTPVQSSYPRSENGRGLTSAEAQARLKQFGPNAVIEERPHPFKEFIKRFWAPIPWLLEATIIIQFFLGEGVEAAVIGGLLVLNAILSFLQEGRAQKALTLLRQQLHVQARVRRDAAWTTLPAEGVVPGDVIHLRQGSIVPADVRVEEGSLLADQSALTGESAAVSVEPGKVAYAGSMIRGGEATGEVTATGARTFFGKTAELVRTAGSANRQEHEIVGVVRNLFVVNAAMVVIVTGYAHLQGMSLGIYFAPAARHSARFDSSRFARHLYARSRPGFGGIVQTRRADHAAQRPARYCFNDGIVQRQNRNPYAERGHGECDLAGAGFCRR